MESAHRQMMMILANCGQRSAALDQCATCQKLLQAELGVDPAKETTDLYEQIHAGKFVAIHQSPSFSLQSILDTRRNNLPLQLTSFIGREEETAAVVRLLNTYITSLINIRDEIEDNDSAALSKLLETTANGRTRWMEERTRADWLTMEGQAKPVDGQSFGERMSQMFFGSGMSRTKQRK